VVRAYYRFRYWEPIWYKVINRNARQALARYPSLLDATQEAVLADLRRDGISVIPMDVLLGDGCGFERYERRVEQALVQPRVAQQIAAGASCIGGKSYLIRAFRDEPVLDLSNELIALALNDRILVVVNAYLGMCSRLKGFDLWYNLPVARKEVPTASQRWHRDYDDHRLIKLFLYMVDVDESRGPFTYARGTHAEGKYGRLFPTRPPQGAYPPDGSVERHIPGEAVKVCTGSAGTLILCDTTGLHRGGRSTTEPRILFTATYASDAAIDPDCYLLSDRRHYEALSPAARHAIRLPAPSAVSSNCSG
jgi:hypothetical protein